MPETAKTLSGGENALEKGCLLYHTQAAAHKAFCYLALMPAFHTLHEFDSRLDQKN